MTAGAEASRDAGDEGARLSSRLGALLPALTAVAVLAPHALLLAQGRFFATEDDGYRAYHGVLLAQGAGSLVGRFWLPGQFVLLALLGRLGLDAALAPLTLNVLARGATLWATFVTTRALAPPALRNGGPFAAVALGALSPLALVSGHSALAEPLANALVALAVAGLARRYEGGSRRALAAGALAALAATWVRYEAWWFAGLYALAAAALGARRAGSARSSSALTDAALGALALLGPLGWMLAQRVVHGDALAFVQLVNDMALQLAGPPSRLGVLEARAASALRWMPLPPLAALTALALLRRERRALAPAALVAATALPSLLLEVASGRGLGVFHLAGRAHDFFSARLLSHAEVALWPLAGVGLAALAQRRTRGARALVALFALSATALLVRGAQAPLHFVDESSVQLGLALRRGAFARELAGGALLVERVEPRPPMGWASLGAQWSQWHRTAWCTVRGDRFELVRAHDVRGARVNGPLADLGAELERQHVRGAWVLTERARAALRRHWPDARAHPLGDGVLLLRAER